LSKTDLQRFGIVKIGLFGSCIRNEATNDSDIDILIDFDKGKETFNNFMNVCEFLENTFKGQKVDIVSAKGLSPFVGPYILNEVVYA
jgi:predicted nucleotidyltransferase